MSADRLNLKPDGLAGFLVSAVLGAAVVMAVFGTDFVMGRSVFWRTDMRDVTQYVAGFNFYFNAPWQSPLLAFDALNYPQGTLATFVDAIPLFALLLKVLAPDAWAPFNPYGFWVAICFVFQAIGGWCIAKELQTKSWTFLLTLLGLLLSFPALLDRIGHISLMSHWLLLFAVALYLRSQQANVWPQMRWTILCVAAFYINIYLFVMVGGVLLSACISATHQSDVKRLQALLLPAMVLCVTAYLTMWPLPAGKPTPEFGFGYYAMNLVSPWMGGNLMPMPAWLGLNPIAGFTYVGGPGQYEGFNYLGLGVLLLIALNAIGLVRSVGRHKALFVLLLLFSVYALSSNVMLGGRTFFEFKYPESLSLLTSQFRASGRFFWLVGYVLLVASLYKTYQILQARHFIGVCLLVALMQVVDLQGVYRGLNFRLQRVDAPRITTEQWDAALGQDVSVVYAYPKFKCGKDPQNSLLPLMKYASERQLKLNTGYIARYTPDCLDMNAEVANSNPAVSAYVFSSDALPAGTTANSIFPKPWTVRCQFIDFAQVCRVTDWKTKP